VIYLGIDPGQNGALAALREDFSVAGLHRPEASPSAYAALLRSFGEPCMAAVEKSTAWPGQGVVSMHRYGIVSGWWEGALAALSIPYLVVAPRRWQATVYDSRLASAPPKQRSLELARRLWPSLTLGRKDDALADALLIARWCRMQSGGPQPA
jgi:crossover junction endodeoxyribonuclease RuvC